MTPDYERRVVLLAATAQDRETLRRPFDQGMVPGWDPIEADSFERARFVLHHDCCDVILMDGQLCSHGSDPGLSWLTAQQTPVLLLADARPEAIVAALQQGVVQWLPRDMALNYPQLLGASLAQVAEWGALQRHLRTATVKLQESRLQVYRMVTLMWDASHSETRSRWFSQGHMMGRLHEECVRSVRYGTPLTIALGEVRRRGAASVREEANLGRWAAERITEAKRRCDVLGAYGPHGFMLLLVNTPSAGAEQCCRRIRQALADVPEGQGNIEAVFGLASCPHEGDDSKTLLSRAERALEARSA